MNSPDLSIVIVNWNSKDFLRDCLDSILALPSASRQEIIVVDSASFDGSGDMLRRFFPGVVFIQSNENVGFARANNIGAQRARGKVLLFLNPDTVIQSNAIGTIYEYVNLLPSVGVVGCRLLNSDGSLQRSCVQPMPTILNQMLDLDVLQRWFPRGRLWVSGASFEGETTPVAVEAVSGACMMMKREVFWCVSGFSSEYFMYAEDLDLCWKVRNAGFTNYYVGSANIVHHGGGSTRKKRNRFADVMIPESNKRLLIKARGQAYATAYKIAMSTTAALRLMLLAVSVPIWIAFGELSRWRDIFGKWLAVLKWAIGLEQWAKGPANQDISV